jgi:hypothetical protein
MGRGGRRWLGPGLVPRSDVPRECHRRCHGRGGDLRHYGPVAHEPRVGNGRQTEIKLEKDFRLLLTPTIQKDGNILLTAEIHAWDGGDFKLASKPRLLMRQGAETACT